MTTQDEHTGLQVAEFKGEPEWLKISWKYVELADATKGLHADIAKYNAALNELDGAGTSIMNGKDRIFLLREEIARLESASK